MAKARWKDVTLAKSDQYLVVEGNYYFPPDDEQREYLRKSKAHSLCFWKGVASYYGIEVDGAENQDAARYYPHPSPLARRLKNYFALLKWRPNRGRAFQCSLTSVRWIQGCFSLLKNHDVHYLLGLFFFFSWEKGRGMLRSNLFHRHGTSVT